MKNNKIKQSLSIYPQFSYKLYFLNEVLVCFNLYINTIHFY